MTMEEVASQDNLRRAFERVASNDGAPGPDRQSVAEVRERLDVVLPALHRELLDGSYRPGLIRRVWIPKSGGGERGLGIPDVVDRLVQQAVHQVLSPNYEPTFHGSSHGFRPGRSCHTAIAEAAKHLEEGHEWVVDLDLEKFFDRVHHDRLIARLELRVKDRRLICLIRRMLKAQVVLPNGVVVSTEEGTPQGGPLSPLLSNIVLDELDHELTQRGHRFVRYADDCNIYVRSERSGQRVMASVVHFIESRLRLKVNAAKSAVARPEERHFVGFRLRREPGDGSIEVLLSKRSKARIDETNPRADAAKLGAVARRLHLPGQRVPARLDRLLRDLHRSSGADALQPRRAHPAAVARSGAQTLEAQKHDCASPHPARGEAQNRGEGLRGASILVGAQSQHGGAQGTA